MVKAKHECAVCRKTFDSKEIIPASLVRDPIAELIRRDYPGWSGESAICKADLSAYRSRYVQSLLEAEMGELTDLEKEVLESLQKHELISSNIGDEFEQDRTFGEKLSDRLAAFGGSWTFLIIFALFMLIWITINSTVLFWRPVDPYPFILLNLLLSCLAAIQAPIIMMSQNRQEAKDRLRAQYDYQINLKAELEIRLIHEKLDHLLSKQWQRMMQIQQVQIEQLSEVNGLKKT
jgi:uncharacterized membrane protein